MSRRAIDRFRPQPAGARQTHAQERRSNLAQEIPSTVIPDPLPVVEPETVELETVEPETVEPHSEAATLDSTDDATSDTTENSAETTPETRSESPALGRGGYDRLRQMSAQMARTARLVGVPLIWLGVVAFCGGTGYAAFNWLFTIPPIPNCNQIWLFSLDSDKLFCAEQAARSGKVEALTAGLKLTEDWSPNNQLHPRVTQLRRQWSKTLLQAASNRALQNKLDEAIAIAEQIKPGNPVYRDAKNAVLEWKKLRDRDQTLTADVEAALKAQDWKRAEASLRPPGAGQVSEYQRQQFNRLKERIMTERMAFNQLRQLRELVKVESTVDANTVDVKTIDAETLGRAMQLAAQINPNRYISSEAKQDVGRWNELLVKMTSQRLAGGDVQGAIAAARWISADTTLPPNIQDLLWVSQAPQFSPSQTVNAPPHAPLWRLTTTLAALQGIEPQSPVYPQAQAKIPLLRGQIQDLSQLSLANAVASVPQIPALQVASQIAQSISLDRPHRLDAQTLIAKWQKDIERIEDRPYLNQAQRSAKSGKPKDLQTAITQAGKISLGRALRPDAQAVIFDWKQQIQTIEDKPILTKARQFVGQKQLAEAVREANKIAPGRALYPEAQAAISGWTRTMQIAADRPILDQARRLASGGSLGAAIDVAYQIAPERALYTEAQQAIANWSAQLAATRRRRGDDRYRSNDPNYTDRYSDRYTDPPLYDLPRR